MTGRIGGPMAGVKALVVLACVVLLASTGCSGISNDSSEKRPNPPSSSQTESGRLREPRGTRPEAPHPSPRQEKRSPRQRRR